MPLTGRGNESTEEEEEEDDDDDDDNDDDDGTGSDIPILNSPSSVTETLSAFSLLAGGADSGTDIAFCLESDAGFEGDFEDLAGIPTLSSPISVMISTGISFLGLSIFTVGPEPCFFFQLSHNELKDDSGFWKTGPGAMWEEARTHGLSVFVSCLRGVLPGASLLSKGKILSPAIQGTGTQSAICARVMVVRKAVDFILSCDLMRERRWMG